MPENIQADFNISIDQTSVSHCFCCFFLFVCLFVLFCFNSLSILFIYLFWQIFGALDFPEPVKEKNIQAVSNSLNFSYLSALRSAFSGFNLWLGSEG